MTQPPSIIAGVMNTPWMRNARRRRVVFAILVVLLAILSVFPQRYVARAKIVPNEGGVTLGGVVSQIGGFASLASLLGGSATEIYLHICRGHDVMDDVIARMHLVGRRGIHSVHQAEVRLIHKVDIESTRGGIIQIEAHDHDPAFARELVTVYSAAFRDRITNLSKEQSAEKKVILSARMVEATNRLNRAEAALDRYRIENKLALPQVQLGSRVAQLADLQGQLLAKQVELQTAEQFATSENIQVKEIQADIGAIQGHIAQAQSASPDGVGAESLALKEYEYVNLYRYVQYSQGLYEIYERYLEAANVEDLSAGLNAEVIENPYVEPRRQYNVPAVGLLIAVLLIAFTSEYYLAIQASRRPAAGS